MSRRKARKANLINRGKTLHRVGQYTLSIALLYNYLPIYMMLSIVLIFTLS